MDTQTISKSQFKPKALEYLRKVEEKGVSLIITHNKKPIAKVIPFKKKSDREILASMQGTLDYYKGPNEPVGLEDWEALK